MLRERGQNWVRISGGGTDAKGTAKNMSKQHREEWGGSFLVEWTEPVWTGLAPPQCVILKHNDVHVFRII